MRIIEIINGIINHPFNKGQKLSAIIHFIKWQLNGRLNPYEVIYKLTENSKIIAKKGMTGVTGNIYCGLNEFEDMLFLLHFLREDDVFFDVGANMGVYSVLAGAEIGSKVMSFEPVPKTYEYLRRNVLINEMSNRVIALNIGLASKNGELIFTSALDTINHVVQYEEFDDKKMVKVQVKTLEKIVEESGLIPNLIKIDVEGFEMQVIKGASSILSNPELKAIIIELNGSGMNYSSSDQSVHEILLENGFEPYKYAPYDRKLIRVDSYGSHNTIYVRDVQFVFDRILSAQKIGIQNKKI